MITETFSSNNFRTNLFFRAIVAVFGIALLTLLASCSTSSSTNAPQLADATVVEVMAREAESQFVWDDAEMSGHVDVVDKFGKITQLTAGRRLILSEGSTVRLVGEGLQGVAEAEVWVLSTPRLLNKIPVNTNGSFSAQIMVPTDLEAGDHTVLVSATLADGRVIAVNIPAFVPSVTKATPTTIATATSTPTSITQPQVTPTPIARPQTTTTAPRTIAPALIAPSTSNPATIAPTATTPAATPTTSTTVPVTTTTVPVTTTTVPVTTTTVPVTTTTVPVTTTTVPVTTTTVPVTTTTVPAATYTVTYNSNSPTSGIAPTDAVAYTNGATVTVLGNTGSMTKTGFSFGGWCTTQPVPGATCSGTARAAASTFTISSDITLYAVWTTNTHTITYARGTGASGTHPSSPTTALYGSTFTTPANPYTRAGHTFAGWSDGTTTVAAGSTYPPSGAVVTSNVTLTATWTAITYSITYYDTNSGSGNGGDGGTAPAAQTGSGAVSVTLATNTLVLDGYGFYGWTTTNGSTMVEYTNAQAVQLTASTTLNLYPVWGARTFGTQVGLGASGQTNAAAVQSDGKIVVVGSFLSWNGNSINHVLRLNSDGTRDTAFNASLGSGPGAGQDRVFVQTDDKVVISGSAATWSGSSDSYRIVRLNSDGSLDSAFNTNIGTGPNNNVFGYAQQSDGKLIIVGSFTEWNGATVGRIVRLNTNGTLDTDFVTNIGAGASHSISSVNLQSTGQIILTGSFTSWNSTAGAGRIVRLNTDGTRDTAFSTNIGSGFNTDTYGNVVQSDDKIVVVGNFSIFKGVSVNRNRVLRLNADGTLDTDFSTNIGAGPGSYAARVALQSNGQILVAQGFTTWAGTDVGSLVRLNTDGTRDTSFTATIGTTLTATQVMSMTVQGQRTLIMGLFTSWNGTPVGRIVRINADGTLD